MPLYININDLYNIVKSNADVYIFYRPIPGMGDAAMILPAITGVRQREGNKAILVMLGLDYANTVFEHNDCLDFIVSYTAGQVTGGKALTRYRDTLDADFLKDDYLHVLQLEEMDCTLYRLEHPCPCGQHEATVPVELRRSRQELFAEACDVKFDVNNYNFKLHQNDLEAKEKLELPDRYIVLGIRSSQVWKDYRYIEWLARKLEKLGRQFDFHVVTMDQFIKYPIKNVYGLIDQKLTDLYGVIAQSLMTISACSGYVHTAGALEIPVFGLYGPTPPQKFLRYKKAFWLSRFKRCDRQFCWYIPCPVQPCLSIHPNNVTRQIKESMMKAKAI